MKSKNWGISNFQSSICRSIFDSFWEQELNITNKIAEYEKILKMDSILGELEKE